jgi:hypothetical protein
MLVAAHIFKHEWAKVSMQVLGIDIDVGFGFGLLRPPARYGAGAVRTWCPDCI